MALILEIRAKSKRAADQISKDAKRAGGSVRKLEKTSKVSANRISTAFQGVSRVLGKVTAVLGPLGLAGGLAGGVFAIKKMISAASDVTEAMNLVRVTFGKASKDVEAFAAVGERVGASRGEVLAMTGEIGSLIKSFGFVEQASADFSTTIVQLAADIGSFKNAKTDEVLNAIRASLIGSSEPMLRFGADTREAALQQEALRLGIIETTRKLTTEERAIAALSKIARDNKDAIGDFSRTQGDFATSSKILAAELKTANEEMGEKFIPAATKFIAGVRVIVKNIDGLGQKIKDEFDITKAFEIEEGGIADKIGNVLSNINKFEIKFLEKLPLQEGGYGDRIRQFLIDKKKGETTEAAEGVFDNIFDRQVLRDETQSWLDDLEEELNKAIEGINERFKASIDVEDKLKGIVESFGKTEKLAGRVEARVKPLPVVMELFKSKSDENLPVQMEIAIQNERQAEAIELSKQRMEQLLMFTSGMAQQMSRAIIEGKKLSDILGDILKQLAQRGLAGLIGGAIGFAIGGPVGAAKGFNIGFGADVFKGGVKGQHGLDFTVPQGFPNDSFQVPLNVSSGERVQVTPANQTTNNTGVGSLIINTIQPINEFFIESRLFPAINRGIREGKIRLGTVDVL